MEPTQQVNNGNVIPTIPPDVLVRESHATFVTRGSESRSPDSVAPEDSRAALPDERAVEAFGFHVHKYITEYIRFADQKAAFVFALSTGLLCYGFKNSLHHMWLKALNTWSGIDAFCFIAMTMLVLGLFFSCWVIVPNLKKSHRGFVFFGSISEYESASAYASEILATSSVQLCRSLLQHTYDISKVCSDKYWKLNYSLCFSAIGVVAFILVIIIKY